MDYRLAFAFIILLALAIRLLTLTHESFFMDEIWQTSFYAKDLFQLFESAAGQAQPPLDYLVGQLVYQYAQGDFALRLPSALFGTGAVALMMLLSVRLIGPAYGLTVGLIYALLPYSLYYSQEARPYAIAIFFLLLLLFQLTLLINENRSRWYSSPLLFLTTTAFLHSRALAPLVVVSSLLGLILLVALRRIWIEKRLTAAGNLTAITVALLLGILSYLPNLLYLLERAKRYAPESEFSLRFIFDGLAGISLHPIWNALRIQAEPLDLFLAPAALATPLLLWAIRQWRSDLSMSLLTLLLPLASALYLFAFYGSSAAILRPSYLIFLLPLALISSAYLLKLIVERFSTRWRNTLLGLFTTLAVVASCWSLVDFFRTDHRTDWRALAEHLHSTSSPHYLVMMDSLTPLGQWEPNEFGLFRYGIGESIWTTLESRESQSDRYIDQVGDQAVHATGYVPALTLFHWRDYTLTSRSFGKIMLQPHGTHDGYAVVARLEQHPLLQVTRFHGVTLIELRKEHLGDSLGINMLTLIDLILPWLPQDETAVDLYLAAYELARDLSLDSVAAGFNDRAEALRNISSVR